MIVEISPSLAMWSIPLIPYMSPAAIGCSVVRSRGCPSASKRAPIAASTLSGQPSPEEEDTDTTAPSAIRAAAASAEAIFDVIDPAALALSRSKLQNCL